MNDERTNTLTGDQQLVELLVDGELDEGRRRELLSRLDGMRDGWKRCTLAFLEAQTLRAAMRARTQGSRGAPQPAPAPSRTSAAGRAATWAGAAALVIVAFCGGWFLRPSEKVAAVATGPSIERESDEPIPPVAPGDRDGPRTSKLHLAGIVTLKIDDHGTPREVEVPVLAGSDDELRRLLEQPPAVEASVVQALERRGHKVAAHRQLVAVDLKDGRKLVFPIDQVDVRFAQRVFQ
jgi:hypothetical protein